MKLLILLYFIIFILNSALFSQSKKSVKALYIDENIKIDGFLNETTWSKAEKATDFIQYEPINGSKATEQTVVKILYDNTAIYIAGILYDSHSDSIFDELGQRDDAEVNSDIFALSISPYNDGINEFGFMLTAAGVQADVKYTEDDEDFSWNAVWYSNLQQNDSSWIVEIKIPFSALRIPKKDIQLWGFNVWRQVRRKREWTTWNFVDKKMSSIRQQSGLLSGIENIEPPLRLSATPYLSTYFRNDEQNINDLLINGGLDLKYGINESYTLDMTLIPDFGQVKSDDKILNLTPFETFYGENRPFFTEGTELFSKGDIFYSRRIGGEPINYESVYNNLEQGQTIKENQSETKMLNATKVSGRSPKGLGMGFFNAMTQKSTAIIVDSVGQESKFETQPFTNYNMIVLDKSLKNNSYISFLNTNVYSNILLADVSGTVFNFNDKSNTYSFGGNFFLSNREYNNQLTTGKRYSIATGKVSGNFKFGYDANIIDKKFAQNDMGYLQNNNETNHNLSVEYNLYDPFWKMLNWYNAFSVYYSTLHNVNDFSDLIINFTSRGVFKNYLFSFLSINYSPIGSIDYYEPRQQGRYYKKPEQFGFNFMFSPDYRKNFLVDINGGYSNVLNEKERYAIWGGLSPRIRLSNKFLIILESSVLYMNNDKGYVETSDNNDIIFGNRNVTTVTNTISTSYIFNKKSSLNLRVRHYWSKAEYSTDYPLLNDGTLGVFYTQKAGSIADDLSFNAFTIDMSYTWNFAPGSEISLVWKNSIFNSEQGIITNRYYDNLENTINSPQTNSLSLKILYYIDYELLFRKE